MLVLLVLASVLVSTFGRVGHHCLVNSECDHGECCQRLGMYSYSYARMTATLSDGVNNMTCQSYDRRGDDCDPYAIMGGVCGCEPGTVCTGKDVLTSSLHGRATLPLTPAPGYTRIHVCA